MTLPDPNRILPQSRKPVETTFEQDVGTGHVTGIEVDSVRACAANRIDDVWVSPITGLEYTWDGHVWRSTGRYPYGMNPMGLI